MKTHEISQMLMSLAQILRTGPNVELDDFLLEKTSKSKPNPSTIPVALSALVALSQFSKAQWRAVVMEYGLPIEVKVTESSRDVVGKILRHLETNPESRKKLKAAAQRKSDISPELMNALNILLK